MEAVASADLGAGVLTAGDRALPRTLGPAAGGNEVQRPLERDRGG